MGDLKKNAERVTIRTRDGHQISCDEFYTSRFLAEHFAFAADELDMIVNFDAKFRMGQEDNES